MIRLLQSSWMVALTGCILYLATTAAVLGPARFEGVPAAAADPNAIVPSAVNDPAWKFRNPEFDQWVEEIKREKAALELRAQQLNKLQNRLDAERKELSMVTQTVTQLQTDFDRDVVRLKKQEIENVRRQAKLIASMSPDGAATMVNEMTDDDVVCILVVMKTDEASLILDTMSKIGRAEAKRAAAITERMRRVLPPAPATAGATPPP
jgi:flagellar motility protein MotE (MotC chaperone)